MCNDTDSEMAANCQGQRRGGGINRRLRVWLVDSDRGVSEVLANLLDRAEGIECNRCFDSSAELLAALAREEPPEAILLDIKLGQESGVDLIRPIRSLAPRSRVLMMTTFYDGEQETRALRAGASAFFTKVDPVDQMVEYVRQGHPRFVKTEGLAGSFPANEPAVTALRQCCG